MSFGSCFTLNTAVGFSRLSLPLVSRSGTFTGIGLLQILSSGGGDGVVNSFILRFFRRCRCIRNRRAHLARGGLFGVADALEAAVLRFPGDEPVPLPRPGPGPWPAGHAARPPLSPLGVKAVDGARRL